MWRLTSPTQAPVDIAVQAEQRAAARAFGLAWAERVLGSALLLDYERSQIARAVGRCHADAGLVPPTVVCWVATPEDAAAFLAGDESRVRCRTDTRPDPGDGRRRPPWLEWWVLGRPVVRGLALLMSPVVGAAAGLLASAVLLMFWLSLTVWLVLAGTLMLILLAARWVPRWPAGGAASGGAGGCAGLAVLIVGSVGLIAVLRVVGEAAVELRMPLPDPVGVALIVGGTIGGAVALPVRLWRSGRVRRRGDPSGPPRGRDPGVAVERLDNVCRTSAARYQVPDAVRQSLDSTLLECDPLIRSTAGGGRLSSALLQWAWSENLTGPGRPRRWAGSRPAVLSANRRREMLRDFETAARVHWQPAGRQAVAVEPPRQVHSGPLGLHRLDGPAVVWSDGSVLYAVHGVRLPRPPDAADWTVQEIHDVPNSETRRLMIESIGWDAYLDSAGLTLLARAPDPGNPPHSLELHGLPDPPYGGQKLLVMTNGSPGRDGRRRRYAEFVPGRFDDPVAAAAWQYDVPVEVYRQLRRRT